MHKKGFVHLWLGLADTKSLSKAEIGLKKADSDQNLQQFRTDALWYYKAALRQRGLLLGVGVNAKWPRKLPEENPPCKPNRLCFRKLTAISPVVSAPLEFL